MVEHPCLINSGATIYALWPQVCNHLDLLFVVILLQEVGYIVTVFTKSTLVYFLASFNIRGTL